MTTAYDNHGDQGPDSTPLDRGFGAIPEPVPPKAAAPSRGAAFLCVGLALVLLSFFLAVDGNPADEMVGDALLISGVINLCTAGIIRAIVDSRPK